ncbi:MAG: (Fe-S)-binding protein [Proteobacteria bacterium]|nr:(Fe-S)-binding protein [Pseudomonadota bacterium]
MNQQAQITDKYELDRGIENHLEHLKPETIRAEIDAVFRSETGSRLKAYMKTCVHCGLCSDACHFFLSFDRDPRYSPAGKIRQTLWEFMKNIRHITADHIRKAAIIAYTECNLCRRCVLYCPFGIDTAYMMGVVRRICHRLGVTPLYLQDTAHSHSAFMNQMWVKEDEWIDTIHWQEDDARDEMPGLRIPLEKQGADIMYSVIAPEPRFQADLIYKAAILMTVAGVNWTLPATPGWDNSDMAMYSGDDEIMGRITRTHFEAAERLNVKKIVMGECGHAFRSVYDTGNRWLGWTFPPIPVIHAIEFYYDLLVSGKITIREKFKDPVTFHDPCNIVRGRGLHEKARYIIHMACENFIEMTPNREHNFCCGAGGGVINCGPPFKNKRMQASRVKADQIRKTGAKVVITPCHNCHSGIDDILHHYKIPMTIKFMVDILTLTMNKPVNGTGDGL